MSALDRWEPWEAGGAAPPLPLGEVHLWLASLTRGEAERAALWQLLTAEERARAERFVFPIHRERFAAGRGLLRRTLALYLDRDPAALRLAYGPHGKPLLREAEGPGAGAAAEAGAEALAFNLSHSGDVWLLAVARGRAVGVDVEAVDPRRATAGIAERSFAPEERRALAALPEPERVEAFFRIWSRKEAYIKAIGLGLAMPLDAFAVPVGDAGPDRLLTHRDDPTELERWTLRPLDVGPGHAAALAVEGAPARLRRLRWPAPPSP